MEEPKAKRGRARNQTPSEKVSVRALERGLLVLETLGHSQDTALSEVSRATGLNCSTVFRLLETLRKRGYVNQDNATGRYRLDAGALAIGASYSANLPLPKLSNAAMQRLVDATDETANLAVLAGVHVVYVHQIEAKRSVRMFTQLGARAPVHCTGVGKALLAWLPRERVTTLMSDLHFEVFTGNTIRDMASFIAELDSVQRQGYAVDDEEREMGVRCVTAPIRDGHGAVVAALSVSCPSTRLPKKLIPQRAREVLSAANEISAHLGYLSSVPKGI